MKFSPVAILAVITFLSGNGISQHRISAARDFLDKNRVFRGDVQKPEDYDQIKTAIQEKPDPESKFGYIVFSIARHSSKLLTDKQAAKLDDLIEKRKNAQVNWHDVRNVVRVHAVIAMWDFAIEKDQSRVAMLEAVWNEWTDLRIAYMFQEFVDKERFQRSVWEILTPMQRQELIRGDWDSYLKKNVGHGRLFSADKQVRRALGEPDDNAAFDKKTQAWQIRWEPMLKSYWQASRFQNRREFSMDEANETFALASWDEYATAFRSFVESERDAVRDLVQSSYHVNSELRKKVTKAQEKYRSDMIRKYSSQASELLVLPGEIE